MCKKHDISVHESLLTFHFKGQRSSGSGEHNANAEAARRAPVIRLGRRSGCSWWSHLWSGRTCCSVRICYISTRKHDRVFFFLSICSCFFWCRFKEWKLATPTLEVMFKNACTFFRIGISEKGQATVKLSVSTVPGHSSMPPRETSIGILAAAIKRWNLSSVLPVRLLSVLPPLNN